MRGRRPKSCLCSITHLLGASPHPHLCFFILALKALPDTVGGWFDCDMVPEHRLKLLLGGWPFWGCERR